MYKNGQSMIEGKAKKNSMVTIETTLGGNFDCKWLEEESLTEGKTKKNVKSNPKKHDCSY
jgi:hypothetical protein